MESGTFNSATAVTPWKCDGFPLLAQFGYAFNSATAVTPWKSGILNFNFGDSFNTFNSATAVTPWKLD